MKKRWLATREKLPTSTVEDDYNVNVCIVKQDRHHTLPQGSLKYNSWLHPSPKSSCHLKSISL